MTHQLLELWKHSAIPTLTLIRGCHGDNIIGLHSRPHLSRHIHMVLLENMHTI